MASAAAAIGTAILGAGTGATAATITGGLVLGAASYGAASLVGGQMQGGGGTVQQGMAPLADKTLPTQAAELEDPLTGEERESEKRRRATAKSRFKVDLADPTERTGVTGPDNTPTGLQI
jgi:hypothetical protein